MPGHASSGGAEDDSGAKLAQLRKELELARADLATTKQQLDKDRATAQASTAAKDRELEALRFKLSQTPTHSGDRPLGDSTATAPDEAAEAVERAAAARKERDDMRSQLDQAKKAREALEAQLRALSGDASKQDLAAALQDLRQAQEAEAAANKQRDEALEQVAQLRARLARASNDDGPSPDQIEKMQRALDSTEAALAALEREKAEEEERALQADRELQKLRQESG